MKHKTHTLHLKPQTPRPKPRSISHILFPTLKQHGGGDKGGVRSPWGGMHVARP
ncbi:hypothetical protein T484DRAFT_1970670 [Baffinella frigidus]|nr:hypothetical protein T484DRAFT_1970670 [Cryptophyta sp. CCMP2293]